MFVFITKLYCEYSEVGFVLLNTTVSHRLRVQIDKTILLKKLPVFEDHTNNLWSSGQSSWLQIQRSGFYSRRYQIIWEVVGLEQGPLSLVSKTEDLSN
jgi:hypothetical protein